MSLVGTRPILQDELLKYELHHRARIAIKPGITGMWQVSGRSDITDFEEVVRLDTEYISNWNFGLDSFHATAFSLNFNKEFVIVYPGKYSTRLQVGIECEPIRVDDYTGKKMTFFHDPDGLPLELHE